MRIGSSSDRELSDVLQVFGMGTSPVLRFFGLTSVQNEDAEYDE